jgi:hypothetical protein
LGTLSSVNDDELKSEFRDLVSAYKYLLDNDSAEEYYYYYY